MTALLTLKDVNKSFSIKSGVVKACRNVNLEIRKGEVLGLVGESGSGKSTIANIALGLEGVDSGEIHFQGRSLTHLLREDPRSYRRKVQPVFQQPLLALNSRRTIGWSIQEPLLVHGIGDRASRRERAVELLEQVGLSKDHFDRYPQQMSGGQLQRVNIARALAVNPELLICDEAVSALDVSVQAQIINLFLEVQQNLGVALLFISHDLDVVRHLSDRIAVMYAGTICEIADTDLIFDRPAHPYTRALLAASSLERDHGLGEIDLVKFRKEEIPDGGCPFAPRCSFATEKCSTAILRQETLSKDREVSCIRIEEITEGIR
jgi:peptide/nickel transport system ATP-binding protein/oligopeptide transport system ATP-binding protein